jgi:pSer/pThr/pTyr-binding forkhead associated (FHA) protein
LGRGPESPVPLDGPSISREHLAFEVRDGRVLIADLSSNGSFLNGQRLSRGVAQQIVEEDEVAVGGYKISFRVVSEPKPVEPPPTPKEQPAKQPTQDRGRSEPQVPPSDRPASRLPQVSMLEWSVLLLLAAVLALVALYLSS